MSERVSETCVLPNPRSKQMAMQMTGHKTRSVFERYNIVSVGDLRHAAQKLDALSKEHIRSTLTAS